jgi:hypothetical protein
VDTDEIRFRFPTYNESNQTVGFYQEKNILDMFLYLSPEIQAEVDQEKFQVFPYRFRHVADGKSRA